MATTLTPLRRAKAIARDRVAVTCGDITLTYGETWDRCTRLAAGLRTRGIATGDRIAVVGANCHRYLELYQAIPGAGMVLVPLNQRHAAAELRYALEDSGARALFTDRDVGPLPDGIEHAF